MIEYAIWPYLAMVPVDHASDRSQPNSRPLEVLISVKPIEGTEQPIGVVHIKAGPIIPHKPRVLLLVPAKIHHRVRFLRAEFHRIAKQILKRHAKKLWIPFHLQSRF